MLQILVQKVAINENVLPFYSLFFNFFYFEYEVHADFILSVPDVPLPD
jgi:hypothetical protein